ncbi:G-alpha-domain-containing protein [Gloeophyllum trabeum ATCC 11539]|uniref:G-alpha-domain-containing protein n=1 Tax=Gloeophyllum trabeum (strain ATCC 11539 / FP-39264 / Madison 617) TaxID=670483 RepID=S7QDZ2_GLOTA|nr:G-alpha-domain-containing protein [Gloeophyllum trabeum ATCC 11539]EPQ57632.1 G-alpha-domain-containing protein [Gloeophyllum trabeum ATCC 11539]
MEAAEDPLASAMAPPEHETDEQRVARESDETRARKISENIDAQIKADRLALKKKKKAVRVLLLGQSESGALQDFQIAYAYRAWTEERVSWRAVIQLNLVRSVNTIVDLLTKEMAQPTSPASPRSMHLPLPTGHDDDEDAYPLSSGSSSRVRIPRVASDPSLRFRTPVSEYHKLLKQRLQPLQRVQRDLEARLGSAATEDTFTAVTSAAPFTEQVQSRTENTILTELQPNPHRPREFFIRSSTGWKAALDKVRPRLSMDARSQENLDEKYEDDDQAGRRLQKRNMKRPRDIDDETTDVLAQCKDDIKALWTDEAVQSILIKRRLRLEDAPGFFLNDIDRIASQDYEPSDDDVVRARLRTVGVQEHRLKFERGSEQGREWILYDVGGSRSCRAAWYPYFDDINAIIFVAPISCFDESLAEDRRVNRLDDSLLLWKGLCACPLLAGVQLILFLNKYDLLEKKLSPYGGAVHAKDYIPGYGKRPNEARSVADFFKQKFGELQKHNSPEPRGFYAFLTSVTDTKATKMTLDTVREGILRRYLKEADLLP